MKYARLLLLIAFVAIGCCQYAGADDNGLVFTMIQVPNLPEYDWSQYFKPVVPEPQQPNDVNWTVDLPNLKEKEGIKDNPPVLKVDQGLLKDSKTGKLPRFPEAISWDPTKLPTPKLLVRIDENEDAPIRTEVLRTFTTVPEPSSLTPLFVGLVGLLVSKRRYK